LMVRLASQRSRLSAGAAVPVRSLRIRELGLGLVGLARARLVASPAIIVRSAQAQAGALLRRGDERT
jgi:hypothetical protein